jgi:heterodisulfide reductase subunit A-like polyferredoxin
MGVFVVWGKRSKLSGVNIAGGNGMPQDTHDLKARMMAEAEEAIDNLLAGVDEKDNLMLDDIERLVRTAGQRVMKQFTQELVETEAEEVGSNICPECGQKMRNKGRKARDLATETGEVKLERAHYYCPECRKGFFPPGPTLEAE